MINSDPEKIPNCFRIYYLELATYLKEFEFKTVEIKLNFIIAHKYLISILFLCIFYKNNKLKCDIFIAFLIIK